MKKLFVNKSGLKSSTFAVFKEYGLEGGIYDKYNSDIACSLPGVHKLYNKLIAYQIFEIGFDRRRQCLKIDFEDFNETMAILKKSNWV